MYPDEKSQTSHFVTYYTVGHCENKKTQGYTSGGSCHCFMTWAFASVLLGDPAGSE